MSNRSNKFLSFLPIVALLWACSDSPTDNPPPDDVCTVTAVGISGAVQELAVGATVQLTGNVTSSNCDQVPTVEWSTSSGAIATVSSNGLVTAVAAGEVTITATAGGKSDNATIDVMEIPVAEIRITPESITLAESRSHELVAEALDASGEVIAGVSFTWTTDTPDKVAVDANGTVTGIAAGGGATVTASAEGFSANTTVRVVRARLAFFWNENAEAGGSRAPDSFYSYNSLGGANSISHGASTAGTGLYSATFGGQGRTPNEREAIFVSGYDLEPGGYCNQDSWTTTTLGIHCHDSDGELANSRWTAAHISSAAFTGRFGFAWVSSGDFTVNPSSAFSFNSSGRQILEVRHGVGDYRVSFEGLKRSDDSQREAVVVNAYGSNASCQVSDWNLQGFLVPDEMVIRVLCFGPDGEPMNSRFTVLLVEMPRDDARLAFAVADQPTTATYSPDNGAVLPTGSVTIQRAQTGRYTVHFADFYRTGDLKETFLISPVGDDPARCHVDFWEESVAPGGETPVSVSCFGPDGAPKDVPFSLIGLQ